MDHTPNRRNPRLLHFDYSKNGAYFITICTQDRLKLLSQISPDPAVGTILTDCGRIVETQLAETERHYPALHIENYVIMPDHIQLLLLLIRENDQPSPQLPEIIRRFKSLCGREWNKVSGTAGPRLFQPSFYDHIIRNDRDHEEIWKYIQNNPAKWREARSAGTDPPIRTGAGYHGKRTRRQQAAALQSRLTFLVSAKHPFRTWIPLSFPDPWGLKNPAPEILRMRSTAGSPRRAAARCRPAPQKKRSGAIRIRIASITTGRYSTAPVIT